MDALDMKIFLTILRLKSISKASIELNLSQPTISLRLKRLEQELHIQLLTRKSGIRNLTLTDEGLHIAELGKRWLALYEDMLDIGEQAQILHLTIASPYGLNNYLLPQVLRKISSREERLNIQICNLHSVEAYDRVIAKSADMGLVFYDTHHKNIISKHLFSEKMYLVCSNGSKWKKRFIKLEELDPKDELFTPWTIPYNHWHDSLWPPARTSHVQSDIPGWVLNFIAGSHYWTICPASVIRSFRLENMIEIHELSPAPPKRECFEIYHANLTDKQQTALSLFNSYLIPFMSHFHFNFDNELNQAWNTVSSKNT